jgi:hypothetical protein
MAVSVRGMTVSPIGIVIDTGTNTADNGVMSMAFIGT